MKKFILLSITILTVGFTGTLKAQIAGKDQQALNRDTLINFSKPYAKLHIDTIGQKRMDAERRQDSIKWKRKADSTAAAVKRKSEEIVAKADASFRDCSLKNVKGPKGETVYVDEYDRRYYINKEGTKVFLKRPALTK